MLVEKTPKKKRPAILQEVQGKSDQKFILLTIFPVGGVGLNLQSFNQVIFMDRHFNSQVILPLSPLSLSLSLSI
jgi:SNF2 family DNA or RNA helicase